MVPNQGGGSVALALVDINVERRKRNEQGEARNVCPSMQVKVGRFLNQILGVRKTEDPLFKRRAVRIWIHPKGKGE